MNYMFSAALEKAIEDEVQKRVAQQLEHLMQGDKCKACCYKVAFIAQHRNPTDVKPVFALDGKPYPTIKVHNGIEMDGKLYPMGTVEG